MLVIDRIKGRLYRVLFSHQLPQLLYTLANTYLSIQLCTLQGCGKIFFCVNLTSIKYYSNLRWCEDCVLSLPIQSLTHVYLCVYVFKQLCSKLHHLPSDMINHLIYFTFTNYKIAILHALVILLLLLLNNRHQVTKKIKINSPHSLQPGKFMVKRHSLMKSDIRFLEYAKQSSTTI